MKKMKGYGIALGVLMCFQTMKGDGINQNDTIKTYNLDEIVITSSTKETNKLPQLPGSVSIISSQAIAGRQIESLKDISSFVPNLYIPDYGAKLTSAIYIRGIGARSSGQSVGLYVDNVPYMDKSTFDFELTDIQHIEVLRGPQGTLYGRNAMGGIVNIYTLSPFDYQGTKASITGGNYETFKAKASHYTKLSETVALSIGGYYDRNDGFFTNEFTGKKVDHEQSAGGRMKLDWRITPNLKAGYSISYDYTKQGAFPYGLYNKATGVTSAVNYNDSSAYKRNVLLNSLSLEYRTDKFTLNSTTGYQYFNDDMLMDQDFSKYSIFTLNQTQKQHAINQEFAIKSNQKNNYQWSFGLFGFYNDLHTEGPVTFKEDGIRMILQPVFTSLKENYPKMPNILIKDKQLYFPGSFDTPTHGLAVFHQSTYNNLFTEGLSLTAGVRLDYEKQKMNYKSTAQMNLGIEMPNGNMIDYALPPTVMDENISQDFWQVLPKLSLKYACTPATFTYLTVSKGYKAGGYNVQMSADVMQSQMQYEMMQKFAPAIAKEPLPLKEVASFKPEQSWNYEAGVRSELLNNRLSAELTLFYMDINDIQLTKFVNSGNGRILANAGKAESYGLEATLRARIFDGLSADANYGYTRATFKNYNDGRNDYKGNLVPYTPRHTLNIGLLYSKLLRNSFIDQFTASTQFAGVGNIQWNEKNDIQQKFYGTVNAKVGVRKGIVKLDLWSKNLTDTKYTAFLFESNTKAYAQKGRPFQIGADVSVAF